MRNLAVLCESYVDYLRGRVSSAPPRSLRELSGETHPRSKCIVPCNVCSRFLSRLIVASYKSCLAFGCKARWTLLFLNEEFRCTLAAMFSKMWFDFAPISNPQNSLNDHLSLLLSSLFLTFSVVFELLFF